MNEAMDILWFKIVAGVQYLKEILDIMLGPLNYLGPAAAILIIAAATAVLTRFLSSRFKTRRYKTLKKEFQHWYNIRQEALKCEDSEEAQRLAKNVDQAKLNKVYYDYFFEGLLNNLATKYLPILVVLSYVNSAYRPENLLALFGRDYVFKIGNGDPVLVGSVFWFIMSLLTVHLVWYLTKKLYHRFSKDDTPTAVPASSTTI